METALANNKLRLIVTGKCNLDCFYCHNEGQVKEDTFISPEFMSRVIRFLELERTPINEVTISGGEPLLHPEIFEIVEQSKRLAQSVTLVSNGVLLNPGVVESLEASGLSKLRLGIDSLRLRKPRPSPGTLDADFDAHAIVEMCRSAGVRTELNTVLTRFNARQIEDLLAFAVENHLSIKFFEHVDVDEFGDVANKADMKPEPLVSMERFQEAIDSVVGRHLELREVEIYRGANLACTIGSSEIRYCKYLCPYGLCWTTGTRIDSRGYVYNCMSNRGSATISSTMTDADLAAVVAKASQARCNLGEPVRVRR